jgi:hypothetical protein
MIANHCERRLAVERERHSANGVIEPHLANPRLHSWYERTGRDAQPQRGLAAHDPKTNHGSLLGKPQMQDLLE